MMQVLVVCVILFFGAAELYQWMQGMELPLPVWVAAGVVLAIASNLNHPLFLSWKAARQVKPSGVPPAAPPAYEATAPFPQLDSPAQPLSLTMRPSENHPENLPEELA
ncbi:MAG TPA: hypothetical protein V6C57_06530 [Coleofasciculaceae cyanobacterium]